jgi:4-amino-4-deoxy-L-arabinose transferase-like glycosyltransferase
MASTLKTIWDSQSVLMGWPEGRLRPTPSPVKAAVALLIFLTFFRWWYASTLELVPDEAYYWLWSKHLDASYYSKGPAIAWTIAVATGLLGDHELGIRWIGVLLAAGTGWQVFTLARRLWDETTALWCLMVASVIPLYAVGSVLMTIDPLSVFFWVWSANLFWSALESGRKRHWIKLGFALGCGFLAKFVNVLEVVSFVGFMLWVPRHRRWLWSPQSLAALVTFLICISPVVWWNWQHGWITAIHLQERGALNHAFHFQPRELAQFLQQQALVISPFIFLGVIIAVLAVWQRKQKTETEKYLLLLFLPGFLFYLALSLNDSGEANWTATSLVGGLILAVIWWREFLVGRTYSKRLVAFGLLFALVQTILLHETFPFNLPAAKDPMVRLRGWRDLAARVQELRVRYQPDYVVANRYQNASELAFYLPDRPVTYVLKTERIQNQFSFWDSYSRQSGQRVFYVTDSIDVAPFELAQEFRDIRLVGDFYTQHLGRPIRRFQVYLAEKK